LAARIDDVARRARSGGAGSVLKADPKSIRREALDASNRHLFSNFGAVLASVLQEQLIELRAVDLKAPSAHAVPRAVSEVRSPRLAVRLSPMKEHTGLSDDVARVELLEYARPLENGRPSRAARLADVVAGKLGPLQDQDAAIRILSTTQRRDQ